MALEESYYSPEAQRFQIEDRHPLTLSTEGKVSEWFQTLHQKRLWTEAKDPRADTIQIELDLAGGGMQGVLHAGLLFALHEHGMLQHIDRIVGVSTGALAAVVAIGMTDRRARDAYLDVAMHGIVDPRRIPFRNAVDLKELYEALRKYIDPEKIQNSHTQLSCIVTDAETSKPIEIDMTHYPDPLLAAVASAAIPGVTKSPIELPMEGGRVIRAVDGMVSSPYPQSTLHKSPTTHRLVASPYPPGGDMNWFQRVVMATSPRLFKYGECRRAIWQLNDADKRDLGIIRTQIAEGQQVGMVNPDQVLDAFSQDWLSYLRPYQDRAEERFGQLIQHALRPTLL